MNKKEYLLIYVFSVSAVILFSILLIYRNGYIGINTNEEDRQSHVLMNTLEMNLSDQWKNILSDIPANDRDSNFCHYVNSLKKPILVFRFKETNCHLCVDIELNRLRKFVETNHFECVLLTSYSNTSHLKKILKMKNCSFNYLNISVDRLSSWKSEEFENPYYFILHSDGFASDFLYADKNTPEITDLYLSNINHLFRRIRDIK